MSDGLADTSVFIARESGRSIDRDALPSDLKVSMITVGELRAGVLSASDVGARERRLATLTDVMRLRPLPLDESVAVAWARLRSVLRDRGQRMPANDSWIAATAMSLEIPVVTQDDDYDVDVSGLDVIKV